MVFGKSKRNRYNLYQLTAPQETPLFRQQTPASLQQPNALPQQSTGQDAREYERLKRVFMSFDKDRSNSLSEHELSRALYNADGTRFETSTLHLMVKLFDDDNSKTLDFREFYFLTKYLTYWNQTFQRADVNKSGTISLTEYARALQTFGYRMNYDSVNYIFNLFSTAPAGHHAAPQQSKGFGFGGAPPVPNMGTHSSYNPNFMKFDKFVESLIWILRLTNVFRKYDYQGNATATFGFEQFLIEGLSLIS